MFSSLSGFSTTVTTLVITLISDMINHDVDMVTGLAMAMESFEWVVLNDTVMGGRSSATVTC